MSFLSPACLGHVPSALLPANSRQTLGPNALLQYIECAQLVCSNSGNCPLMLCCVCSLPLRQLQLHLHLHLRHQHHLFPSWRHLQSLGLPGTCRLDGARRQTPAAAASTTSTLSQVCSASWRMAPVHNGGPNLDYATAPYLHDDSLSYPSSCTPSHTFYLIRD